MSNSENNSGAREEIHHPEIATSSTTDGLPVASGLSDVLLEARVPHQATLVDRRVLLISAVAILLGFLAAFVARGLVAIIDVVTNLSFYGRLSLHPASPAGNALGLLVILPPVIGGIIVGLMARYGSKAIRGHGIPEAMEQVLLNESRIPPRITILKPLSSAISIGSGGPFGAEGPIIATGGALGSLFGQLLRTTAAVFMLCALKLVSWSIALGSGTSGGTLAPLFTIGGGVGSLLGSLGASIFPGAAIDLRLAALVGMAATFAGSSRAFLTSVVFAFETTRQPQGLLPLLAGCTAAYLVSCLLMKNTIMTEKIVRRGVRVPAEYGADFLNSISFATGWRPTAKLRIIKAIR